jgi:hypothetical protein
MQLIFILKWFLQVIILSEINLELELKLVYFFIQLFIPVRF